MTFLAAADIPEAKAIFPLNSFFETREITDKQPQGIRGDVSSAIGPNGDMGGSYRFSGHANSYIEFPNDGGLDLKHSITLLCWLYPENTHDGPIFNYKSSGDFSVHLWMARYGNLYALFKNREYLSISGSLSTNQPFATHKWHYIGASYDYITGMASLWVNGVRVVEKNIGAGVTLGTQDNVRVGVKADYPRYLTARIAAIQFYDVALTAEQINRVKHLGLGNDEYNELYDEKLCAAFTYACVCSVYSKCSVSFPNLLFY